MVNNFIDLPVIVQNAEYRSVSYKPHIYWTFVCMDDPEHVIHKYSYLHTPESFNFFQKELNRISDGSLYESLQGRVEHLIDKHIMIRLFEDGNVMILGSVREGDVLSE